MNIIEDIAKNHDEITSWRHHIHRNPELLFETAQTAEFIIEKLKEFGVDDIRTDFAKNSVVGVINGKGNKRDKTIGLRADMDALPIHEQTSHNYQSTIKGKMHACGHDGHSAMLLGAAQYLASTRDFDGAVVLIFQPAEEGGGGGKVMVDEGMMDAYNIDEVYGMHNWPGIKVGQFGIRHGALMAATDIFDISITGKGGHAAMPHETIDPIVISAQLINALQTIISRNTKPTDSGVISVTKINAGSAFNVIPETVNMSGTVRTLDENLRQYIITRIDEIAKGFEQAHHCDIKIKFHDGYPVTYNHAEQADFAASIAANVVGDDNVDSNAPPSLGGEDFSFMLQARPGAFIFLGQGEDSKGLHHPEYDFNDEIIPIGCSYWVNLVENALPLH